MTYRVKIWGFHSAHKSLNTMHTIINCIASRLLMRQRLASRRSRHRYLMTLWGSCKIKIRLWRILYCCQRVVMIRTSNLRIKLAILSHNSCRHRIQSKRAVTQTTSTLMTRVWKRSILKMESRMGLWAPSKNHWSQGPWWEAVCATRIISSPDSLRLRLQLIT